MNQHTSTYSPMITVYIPVYNREKYVKEAIDSILNQTFKDFELIIVDDGSTDNSVEIIKSYTDPRIVLIQNSKNLGVRKTANRALLAAKGKYIVRLDSDDIATSDRLEKQYDFMETHPRVGLSGGQLQLFGMENDVWKFPLDNDLIKAMLFFEPGLSQGASIIRKEIVEKGFLYEEEGMNYAEDYELWYRLKDVTEFGNIDAILILYRREEQNVTIQLKEKTKQLLSILHKKILHDMGIEASDRQLELNHLLLGRFPEFFKPSDLAEAKAWSTLLILRNNEVKQYPEKAFSEMMEEKWRKLFYKLVPYGFKFVFQYLKLNKLSWSQIRYFLIITTKSIFK